MDSLWFHSNIEALQYLLLLEKVTTYVVVETKFQRRQTLFGPFSIPIFRVFFSKIHTDIGRFIRAKMPEDDDVKHYF